MRVEWRRFGVPSKYRIRGEPGFCPGGKTKWMHSYRILDRCLPHRTTIGCQIEVSPTRSSGANSETGAMRATRKMRGSQEPGVAFIQAHEDIVVSAGVESRGTGNAVDAERN